MPYSFIDIERQKSWIIKAVFLFLVIFYFIVAELIWLITKLFFISESSAIKAPSIFSPIEAVVVFFIVLIIAFIHWHFSTKNMIGRILELLGAVEPDPKDSYHYVFKNVIDEVSVATGGTKIRCYVIPTSSLNAFAVSDFKGDAVIGVTEGLLGKLNRSQLEAVVGHEAAHIASGDSLLTTITCSLFGVYSALFEGVSRALRKVSRGRRAGGIVIYLLIIYIVLLITQVVNFLLNMFLSRQKEYRADAISVRLTRNPISLAEALYTISRGWRGVGQISNSLSPIFITNPDYNKLEESQGVISNALSTHPPIESRLNILLDMAHSNISVLKEGIKPKQKIPIGEGIVEIKEEPKREWLIYKDNSWQGPFHLEELFNLGLNPNSWVSKLDEQFIKRASEDEVLNNAFSNRLTGKTTEEGYICPQCRQPLGEVLYEGAPVFKCYYCEGILANRNVISRIMAREDFAFSPSIAKSAEVVLKTYAQRVRQDRLRVVYELNCPRCKSKMWRGFYSYGYPIEIDRCETCQYTWFDKDELETLQYLFEKFKSGGY
ncbi:MAG: hypothetical protein AMJ78_07165 [Omnitrophica WOR_2 bacterium SM23_29]|nr:MAG: hypothetical protein AMJ78_07165 [Omnitrophica WOR_2 bacterium SM23_29]